MRRILTLIPLIALTACQQPQEPKEISGRALYMENCASCHGSTGIGNGFAAKGMNPLPADLTRVAARNNGQFPWAHVMSQIDGFTRSGDGGAMPEFGKGYEGEMVPFDSGDGILTPTPAPLVALAEYLETLQE